MWNIIKNMVHYIKSLMNGEEYLPDRIKYNYILYFLTFTHILIAIIFGCVGMIWLCIYNVCSVFFYQGLVGLVKQKRFVIVTIFSFSEILLHVILVSLSIGNGMGFSLYCLAMIPAMFYTSLTVKTFRRSTLIPSIYSVLAMVTYIITVIMSRYYIAPYTINPEWEYWVHLFNAGISFFMMICFSLLFTWEMRSSNATLEKRNLQLSQIASRDPLTKLANRRSTTERLNYFMHKLQLDGTAFSVILGDIDDFKKVNDYYGHDCGDKVLVTVSKLITSQLRENDFACRWGGEEILIVVSGDIDTAASVAERIRQAIDSNIVEHEKNKVHVTMTYGVAQAIPGYRIETLIQKADNKLYYGKSHGKNQVVVNLPT